MRTIYKINGVPKDFDKLPFGRQIEYRQKIEAFKKAPTTRSTHLSQKRKSWRKALKEFRDLYLPVEYFAQFNADPMVCYDDVFEIWYRRNETAETLDGMVAENQRNGLYNEDTNPLIK